MENNPKRNAEYYPDPTAYQAIRNVEPQRFPFMPVVYVCSPYAGDGGRKYPESLCLLPLYG